jgi:flagellar hook assembly protein FlgD
MMVLPNPAIGSVRVSYALPGTQPAAGEAASIEIYDARGRLVNSIPVEETTTSHKTITWDGRSRRGASVPAGIYFLKISSGNETISTKFVFLR